MAPRGILVAQNDARSATPEQRMWRAVIELALRDLMTPRVEEPEELSGLPAEDWRRRWLGSYIRCKSKRREQRRTSAIAFFFSSKPEWVKHREFVFWGAGLCPDASLRFLKNLYEKLYGRLLLEFVRKGEEQREEPCRTLSI